MAKQKFQKNDKVVFTNKAPKWALEDYKKYENVCIMMVIASANNFSSYGVNYSVNLIGENGKVLRKIDYLSSSDLALNEQTYFNNTEMIIDKINQAIEQNNKSIERFQQENTRLNERINLIRTLDVSNINQKVLDDALSLIHVSNSLGTIIDLSTAYNICLALKEQKK
jgi:hypothetical protein